MACAYLFNTGKWDDLSFSATSLLARASRAAKSVPRSDSGIWSTCQQTWVIGYLGSVAKLLNIRMIYTCNIWGHVCTTCDCVCVCIHICVDMQVHREIWQYKPFDAWCVPPHNSTLQSSYRIPSARPNTRAPHHRNFVCRAVHTQGYTYTSVRDVFGKLVALS